METDTFIKDKKLLWLLLISFICSGILFFFKDNLKYSGLIEYSNINFDNRSPDSLLSRIKEYKLDNASKSKNISISFEVKAIDDNYDNIFQTASDPATIRLELNHPNILNLLIGNGQSGPKLYQLTDQFELNVWHKMEVNIDNKNLVEVILDNQELLKFADKNTAYEISDIVVGSGYHKTRNFQGEIKNFTLRCEIYQYVFLFECLTFLMYFVLYSTILIVVYKLFIPVYDHSSTSDIPTAYEAFFILGIAITVVVAGQTLTTLFHRPSSWVPFLLLGLSTPIQFYFYESYFSTNKRSIWVKIGRTIMFFSFILFAFVILFNSIDFLSHNSWMLAFLCISISALCTLIFSGYMPLQWADGKKKYFITLALITLILVTWLVMYDLPNWKQLSESLTTRPAVTTVIFLIITTIVHRYFFKAPQPDRFPSLSPTLNKSILAILVSISIISLFLISFRTDTLFLGTSELHWEYFAGPIRNLKNGSWLLWDTPSQYGFLNILLPGLLPFKSSWESLYVFQSFMLFLTSIILFTIYLSGKTTIGSIIFSLSFTFSSLFLADPDLIGPYLYPSSSVMRFFWCYAILFALYWSIMKRNFSVKQIVFILTPLWLMGFLWSSESAIYSSVTFLPAILVAIFQDYYSQSKNNGNTGRMIRHIFLYLLVPLISFIGIISIISCYYWISISHVPDFYCFVEHGLSYAGGFGQIKLNQAGPVWLLFILFCSILIIIFKVILNNPMSRNLIPLVGAAGCLWSIGSYFIGRAVANNVTAILPLLGFISMVALKSSESKESKAPQLILKVISVPIFTIILMTSFGNIDFINKLKPFHTLEINFPSKIRLAEPALQELLSKAHIKSNDPVVYYGHLAAMPQWKSGNQFVTSDRTWLPNPLQLAEEPITEARRNIYLQRFMEISKEDGGYLILTKGEAEDRAKNWLGIINKTHLIVNEIENDKWKIIRYKRR